MVTKNMYNDNNDVVVVAKKTGKVEATKVKGTAPDTWTQYQIGDTWYNEAKANSGKDINTNVKPGVDAEYVAVNGILYYAAKTSAGANKLTDVLFVTCVGQDGLSNDQARVMFPNGDKDTINLKNDYYTEQDGDQIKTNKITAGKFYEYSKSGKTYELIDLATTADFYGDFTYKGTANLNATADQIGTGDRIADEADVIVWTSNNHATPASATKVDFKHITGKQLKALVKGGMKVDGSSNNLYGATLGYFTSDVDGLNRASVIAVEYNSNNTGVLGNAFDNISSNANYGFITKDAVKRANGNIKFTVWTGKDNIDVFAEKSSEKQFTKGTIVGYTDIQQKDGADYGEKETVNVMTDAVAITKQDSDLSDTIFDGVTSGSITGANRAGTKIEASTIRNLPAEDLDDYSTVLYVDSKAGTGVADGKATEANSQKVNGTTYYATNLLVYGTEVAVIDVNEIAGSRYGGYTLPDTIAGLTDVQWLNTRTNDTDEGAAYKGAVMQLSFYADKSGTLTLNNVADIATNDNDGTVTLNVKGGDYNKFDSLIVTGNGNVTATFAADNVTAPTAEKITSLEFKPTWKVGDSSAVNLDIVYENAVGKRPSYVIYAKGDSSKTNLVGSKFTAGAAFTLPSNNDAAAQSTTVTLNGAGNGTYVLELTVGGATKSVDFTVAPTAISTEGTLSGLPTASDSAAAVNAGYTVSGATTGLNAVVTVEEKTNNGGTQGKIEAGDIATATLTITATNANYVLDATAPAAPSGGWIAGTHTPTSWVYTLEITVS